MFEDDARLAARELGLTLTSRNNGGAAEVPLAGVPVKAGTEYLRRLIAKGHRVAICEQVEDPKLAKGLVRREVVETITPGTVLAEDWLERKRNNFLVALDPRGPAPGLAALDLARASWRSKRCRSRTWRVPSPVTRRLRSCSPQAASSPCPPGAAPARSPSGKRGNSIRSWPARISRARSDSRHSTGSALSRGTGPRSVPRERCSGTRGSSSRGGSRIWRALGWCGAAPCCRSTT